MIVIGELVHIMAGKSSDFHRSIVNTGNNTLAQTLIFAGLFYNVQGEITQQKLHVPLFDLFLVGRILFSLGYSIGTSLGYQSFRAYGFGFTVACIAITLSFNQNFELLKTF